MARLFNGTNDSIEAASAPVTTFPFTMACWARPSATTAQILMAIGVSGGIDRCTLVFGGSSIVSAGANNSSTGASSSFAGTPTSGAWIHAACVHQSTTSRSVYYNGAIGSNDTNLVTITGLNRLNIGARYNTTLGAYFNGSIADAGVWNAALNADEIASLSKGFPCRLVRPSALVFYSRLIRNVMDLRSGITLSELGTGTTASDHPRIIYPC